MKDTYNRPDWDSYFMALAFVASQRSIDPSTKHGCVITASDHTILSIGFNGPPRNSDESKVPLTRPEKYPFMAHAEANAIDNSAHNLRGSNCIAYVTGVPCSACLLRLIQNGVNTVVYGQVGSNMVDETDAKISSAILASMKLGYAPKMIRYEAGCYADVLVDSLEYIVVKCPTKRKKPGLIRRLWCRAWGW